MPAELIDGKLESPALSRFDVAFHGRYNSFRTAMGHKANEFALQCLCAAGLAIATQGDYVGPQRWEIYQGVAS